MRSTSWCFSLIFLFIICSFGEPIVFAQSMEANHGASIVSASNIQNTALAPQTAGAKPAIYTSSVKTGAGVPSDSRQVKQSSPPEEAAPSPGKPRLSFWQWLSGRKVDCSSGVCIVK